jgi:hypothetical protein
MQQQQPYGMPQQQQYGMPQQQQPYGMPQQQQQYGNYLQTFMFIYLNILRLSATVQLIYLYYP